MEILTEDNHVIADGDKWIAPKHNDGVEWKSKKEECIALLWMSFEFFLLALEVVGDDESQ